MVRMRPAGQSQAINVELDLEERYRARLEEIEERESEQPTARKNSSYLLYKFTLHSLDNVPVLDNDGDPYLQFHLAGTYLDPSTKPGTIGSRELAEALHGRKLTNDEVNAHADDWDDWLIGKTAIVDLMQITDKAGVERIRIVRILPDRGRPVAAVSVPPSNGPTTGSSAATTVIETREERLARLKA